MDIDGLQRFSFGDSPELADELLALVLAGTKTATCGDAAWFEAHPEEAPVEGALAVVLDGAGRPAAVIETLEVTRRRFDEVDREFVEAEGEDDGDVESWRRGHEAFFRRNGHFSPDMMLVCERFRLVAALPR